MSIEIKGGLGGLVMMAMLIIALVCFAFVLGIPRIFGVSLAWNWATVDQGHTAVRAFTPKIASVQTRDIFLSAGEELVATYDFRLDAGRARVSVFTWGWMPAWGDLQTFHQNPNIRAPMREEVRVVAPRSGFYTVSGSIVDATGNFTIDWQVERTKHAGQGLRLVSFAMSYLPLILLSTLLLAILVAGVRKLVD